MGFWDFLRRGQQATGTDVSYAWFQPNVTYLGASEWESRVLESIDAKNLTPAQLWRMQPHLRTVVDFVARNVAHLGLHVFERDGDDRRRSRTDPLSMLLANPGDGLTAYRLIYALVGDKMLYGRAFWIPGQDSQGLPIVRRVPPSWVSAKKSDPWTVQTWRVARGDTFVDLPADRVLAFGGYDPTNPTGCSPTIEALKNILDEQVEAAKYRTQVWRRGGRASAVLERPVAAPTWSPDARERFREDWYSKYTGDGSLAGGTPILEDGMSLKRIDFTSREQEWVDGAKLALATVASAFHINPTMVGVLDNANYSNVREFRRMLYGDSLGPLLAEIEADLNTFALPALGIDRSRFFVEFNIAEKLQGSFEEQAQVMSTMVGAPIMTRDEGRARFNLPALGGDAEALVTPLNVLIGGQASPQDSGSQNRRSGLALVKARAPRTHEARAEQVLAAFFDRQERALRSALGAKSRDWWDGERWDRELSEDLLKVGLLVSTTAAKATLDRAGIDDSEYDEDRTVPWLTEVAARSASSINETTAGRVEAALDGEDGDVDAAFDGQAARAGAIATALVTTFSGFGSVEAASQTRRGATKTWVTGKNPRPEHAAMDGETVGLDGQFSNGASWPGDGANLGADDLAGCNCSLVINFD